MVQLTQPLLTNSAIHIVAKGLLPEIPAMQAIARSRGTHSESAKRKMYSVATTGIKGVTDTE